MGKVDIPDSVLLCPGKLSPEQFGFMKTHTSIGFSFLRARTTMEMAAGIAAVVDVFDALRSPRPCKEPWTAEKAFAELRRSAGALMDPEVVSAFLQAGDEIEAMFRSFEH